MMMKKEAILRLIKKKLNFILNKNKFLRVCAYEKRTNFVFIFSQLNFGFRYNPHRPSMVDRFTIGLIQSMVMRMPELYSGKFYFGKRIYK